MFKKSDELQFGNSAPPQGARPGELVCAGEDLKDMLAMLSRQFVEADQRNAATLHDMRGRLENMGRTAESVREHVPAQYAPAFARIEDGVQLLAERIAAVGREREYGKAAASVTSEPHHSFEQAQPVENQHAHAASIAAAPIERAALAPIPAPVAAVFAAPIHSQSVAGNAAEPWDVESAAALARLYESGEANFGAIETESPLSAPTMSFAAAPKVEPVRQAVPEPTAYHHADRAWLEERFAAIATRVEQSLVDIRPDNALLAFDGRLEQLEQRFSNALGEVATRADVDGLRIIEAHINELSAQFESAQGQLGRLDNIELQLGDLMHQVSDERFANLLGQFAPAGHQGPTEEDIEVVAMAVADRVASRLPLHEAPAAAIEQGSISDLKRLVEGFVAGQRENEEHTSTMLDTMQQAMIRMLDRMDALESAPQNYAPAQANFSAPTAPPATAPVMPAPRAEPTFTPEPVDSQAIAEAARAVAGRAMPQTVAPQNKEDFRAAAVADARRAARKVAGQSGEATSPQMSEGVRVRRGAPAVEVSVPESPAEDKPRSRTPLMVAGIALVAAIGLLAASVGMNRGLPGLGGDRQTAQQKAPLVIDNGSVETSSGDLASAPKSELPTPSIETPGALPRPANAAAPQRPGASLADPRAHLRSRPETAIEGLSDRQDLPNTPAVVEQQASIQVPATAASQGTPGMMVTPVNANATNSDLARMRQQRNMASLANQLAAVQANAPTLPASMLPDNVAGRAAAEIDVATPAEMPPAQIGPNSLRIAAQKGDPSAEFEVAARFAEGRGVAQDFKQATSWYSRAAQRGFAPAQYRLGTLYERGIGTKSDIARAKIWYGRAAEQGHVKAMHNLAVLNAGREQSADYAMAVHWFTAAAERGLADSQFNLGVLHESGLGLPRDLKQAYLWLSLAARNGDKEAARRRDQVRMKLDEADAAAADQSINAWRAKPVDSNVNEARAAGEVWKQRQSASR